MKTKLILIAFLLYSTMGLAQNPANDLKVVSYNIRYNNPDDGVNRWENRKEWLTQSITFFEADIVGAQEATFTQLKDMADLLPGYQYIGEGRGGGEKGEFSPIFYLKECFELLESDTFWLSETPEKVASKGWDAALPRIVTWARFKDKRTGNDFFIFNTHFDHRGEVARQKSAEIISRKAEEIAGNEPLILTGDFNTPPDSEPYNSLIRNGFKDSHLEAEQVYGPGYTFNSWDVAAEGNYNIIDFVFYRGKELVPLKYHVLDGQRGKHFVSDHFPVFVKFDWKKTPDPVTE